MKRVDHALAGLCVLEPQVFGDERGFFVENYNAKAFASVGIETVFVQDNHSRSRGGVLRGLHYQIRQPQAKLVRVTVGQVFDVAVDIRRGSPTFGRWSGEVLSAENCRMLYVPVGFAHGFYVMSDVAEVQYKCSDYYAPEAERGVIWNDPALAIAWPLRDAAPTLSARDRAFGTLASRPAEDLPAFVP